MSIVRQLAVAALMALAFAACVFADDAFFPVREGTVLLYGNVRKEQRRPKPKTYTRLTVRRVERADDGATLVTYQSDLLDKRRRIHRDNVPTTHTMRIDADGYLEMDVRRMLANELDASRENPETGAAGNPFLNIEGGVVRFPPPSRMSVGDNFEDVTMTVQIPPISKTVTTISNQTCAAVENITVPAGTFRSHKLTQDLTINTQTIVNVTVRGSMTSWYAAGIGPVKTVTYNARGKMTSGTLLMEITNP